MKSLKNLTISFKEAVWLKTVFFLLAIFIVSCKEDPILPEPEPEPQVIVTGDAYAKPTSIFVGDTITVTYIGSKDVVSVDINGTIFTKTSDSIRFALKTTTTFTVTFLGKNKETCVKTAVVTVIDKPIIIAPTRTDTLCERYWMLISSKIFYQDTWLTVNLDEDQLTRKTYFYKNFFCEIIKKDGTLAGNGPWGWIGKDSIDYSGNSKYQLTDTSLVIIKRDGTIVDTYKGYHL